MGGMQSLHEQRDFQKTYNLSFSSEIYSEPHLHFNRKLLFKVYAVNIKVVFSVTSKVALRLKT